MMRKLLLTLIFFTSNVFGAISYVGNGDRVVGATSDTINPPLPAGWNVDDVCLTFAWNRQGNTEQINTITGWTDWTGNQKHPVLTTWNARIFYKVMEAGDTSPDVTSSGGTAGYLYAIVACFDGVDTTTPSDASPTVSMPTASSTMTAPTITTATNNAWSLRWYASDENNVHNNNSEGTIGYSISSSGGAHSLTYLNEASSGPTGTATMDQSINGPSDYWAITLALRPDGGVGGGPTVPTPKAQWDVNTRGQVNNDFYDHVNGQAETSSGSFSVDSAGTYDGINYNGTSSDYTLLTKPSGLSSTFMNSDFTIAMRFKSGVTNPSVYETMFLVGLNNVGQRISMLGGANGYVSTSFEVGGGTDDDFFSGSNPDDYYDGNEHVIVIRRNGNSFTSWIDGSVMGQGTPTPQTMSALGYIALGYDPPGTEFPWMTPYGGTILWVAIWDQDLLDTEVALLDDSSNPFITGGESTTTWTDDTPTIAGTAIAGTLNNAFSSTITKCTFLSTDELVASNATTSSADCATAISDLTPTGDLNNTQIGVVTTAYLANTSETSIADNITLGCPTGAICGTLACAPVACRGDSLAREATNIAKNDDFIIRFTSGSGTCNNNMVCEYTSATATVEWRIFDFSASPDIWLAAETKNVETPSTSATTEDTIEILFSDCGDGTFRETCP